MRTSEGKDQIVVKHEELKEGAVFPLGEENMQYQNFFIGTSYLETLVADPAYPCQVSHVTFEPGCRNHWHAHEAGQILLVTGGIGWYQEYGKPAQKLQAGDVVKIPVNVKHWHGAAADSWFAHLAIAPDMNASRTDWFEPVANEEYSQLEE